ncbi:probable sucrose-phosphate synthase 1 [Olea europaea var. sylvestris]|uniref:probable sucrose-phosphate synthase 1 n=1 Tax=Olea europaea var. sylvestris TaxID=158386 RepID=UPI000C1CE83B|nr:probable sucrose-phosphate synthase 1 [Olea europaea var. sylvestris]
MELGRDSDTGGQVKYVVELARALGAMPGVYRVDLLTRQVSAPDVDFTYSEPIEMLNPFDTDNPKNEIGESGGAYIIRIPFGPKDKYISKELLWPHIPEFVDGALSHIVQISEVLGKQVGSRDPLWPVAIHGHYADAGNSAALLSGVLNVPMIFTGHSLGQDKLEQLLKQGRQSREEINATYKIMRRIEAEEISLDVSEVIITSTRQEIEEQWRLCDGFDPVLERKLRARIKRNVNCYGRSMPRMVMTD